MRKQQASTEDVPGEQEQCQTQGDLVKQSGLILCAIVIRAPSFALPLDNFKRIQDEPE